MASTNGGSGGGRGGDVSEEISAAATTTKRKSVGGGDESASSSPRNRVKFMCSYGGKILLRPNDGQLKYTGGETRVVAVPRDINFSAEHAWLQNAKKASNVPLGDVVKSRVKQFSVINRFKRKALRVG